MNTVKYVDLNGKFNDVEVNDEIYVTVREIDKIEQRNERKETRRCQSLEASMENGFDVVDESADIESALDRKQRYARLYQAINALPSEQRQLICLVFFEGVTQAEIARRENVSRTAIAIRLQKILKKLKKFLV